MVCFSLMGLANNLLSLDEPKRTIYSYIYLVIAKNTEGAVSNR